MLYNKERALVWHHTKGDPSHCPECGEELLPKRPEFKVWHWAHYPRAGSSRECRSSGESEWHLSWKLTYSRFNDWRVEEPVYADGRWLRLDAMGPQGQVREFVHSVSSFYSAKDSMLRMSGRSDIMWLVDWEEFGSDRPCHVGKDGRGVKRLLKPRAQEMVEEIRSSCLVHKRGCNPPERSMFYRRWKSDVWFPVEGRTLPRLARAYEETLADLRKGDKTLLDVKRECPIN